MSRFQKFGVDPEPATGPDVTLHDLIGAFLGLDDEAFGAAMERSAIKGGQNGRPLREGETFYRCKTED
jgi:hypothetical protein